jgi:hypothetical protein
MTASKHDEWQLPERPITAARVHAKAAAAARAALHGPPKIKRKGPYLGRWCTTPLGVVPAEPRRPHTEAREPEIPLAALYDLRASLRAGRSHAELAGELDDLLFLLSGGER